jgi:alpha-amylase
MAMKNTVCRVGGSRSALLMVAAAGFASGIPLPGGVMLPGATAQANDNPVILQWFETRWADMERRMPDAFIAGYGATWIPPVSLGGSNPSGNTDTVGYDPWDRFDLGRPGRETAYGTEQNFRAVVAEFKAANFLIYVDSVLNHNGGRQTSAGFQTNGGWPGFWMAPQNPMRDKLPTDNWGDFHNGIASGYFQSENPGGARYDRERGDLVALVDIDQGSNHQFIRHPVAAGNPQNIPAGTTVNLPNPANAARYPDLQLTPFVFANPGTFRNPGVVNFTVHPYNTTNPLAGDPIADNATGLLFRWTQWMLDNYKIDGFRLDAIKHAPSWFWDTFFDSAVHQRRTTPDGRIVTPFSFGESVEGNQFTYDNYIRKPNNIVRAGDSFGNRDALDLSGAGSIRDLLNAGGFGDWQNVLNSHLDIVDDPNNLVQDGSLGIFHVFSHDNGTVGNGSAQPAVPTIRQQFYAGNAYLLGRSGAVKVYHNGRGINRGGGFWPRAGIENALGINPQTGAADRAITNMVQIHNQFARGQFFQLNFTDTVNSSKADVLIFDRRTNNAGNVLVAVSDRWDAGTDTRSVLTSWLPGTRLREYTGNAANPVVDPTNAIADVLTVDGSGRVLITVPRNRTGTTEHGLGFLAYAPAIPNGTVSFVGSTSTLPADPLATPATRRRAASLPIVSTPTFQLELNTTPGDPLDIFTDDLAVFRIGQGWQDLNGTGNVDYNLSAGVISGYEGFRTIFQPAYNGSTAVNGRYAQIINTSQLQEGVNYGSIIAFRKRFGGDAPIFREFRVPFYVDRIAPPVQVNIPARITTGSLLVEPRALDRTTAVVHVLLNVPPATDPRTLTTVFNAASRRDRFEWFRTIGGMQHGFNEITVVAYEENRTLLRSSADRYTVFVDLCPADFNDDGSIDFFDYLDFVAAFDSEDPTADFNGDSAVDFFDYLDFVSQFDLGC